MSDPYAALADFAPQTPPPPAAPVDPYAAVADLPPPTARITVDKYAQAAADDRNRLIAAGAPMGMEEGYTRRALNALTLGWADDALAGMSAPLESIRRGVPIAEGYRYARAQQDLAKEMTAKTTDGAGGVAADVAGALASPASAVFRGAAQLARGAGIGARLANSGGNYLANIGKAGALGTVYGAGEAPRVADTPMSSLVGGVTGAIGGAVLPAVPLVLRGAGVLARPFVNWMRNPESAANTYLAKIMQSTGRTPQQIQAEMQEAHAAGQPFTFADAMGHEGTRALAAYAKQPGAQRQMIYDAMERSYDMPVRVGQRVATAMNAPQTARQATEALIQQGRTQSRPVYDASMQIPTYSERIGEFLNNPRVRAGLRHGVDIERDLALAEGRPPTPFDLLPGADEHGLPIVRGVPNMATLHAAKTGLDAMEEAAMNHQGPYGPQATAESRAIGALRRSFVAAIDAENPTYAEARRLFAGPAAVRRAVQRGREMARSGLSEDNIREFAAATPARQAGLRIGWADQVRTPLERSGNYPALLRDKSLKGREELAAFAVPGEADPARRFLQREQTMIDTQNAARGGSPSAENFADMANTPGGLKDAMQLGTSVIHGHPASILSNLAQLAQRAAKGETARQREAITRALLEQDPAEVATRMAGLQQLINRARGVNTIPGAPPWGAPPSAPPPGPRIEPRF